MRKGVAPDRRRPRQASARNCPVPRLLRREKITRARRARVVCADPSAKDIRVIAQQFGQNKRRVCGIGEPWNPRRDAIRTTLSCAKAKVKSCHFAQSGRRAVARIHAARGVLPVLIQVIADEMTRSNRARSSAMAAYSWLEATT